MSVDTGHAPTIQGELQRQGQVVVGWCWSPSHPNLRLTVELLVEGRSIAAMVAARLRLDLVRDGVCDGYHGFTLALPAGTGSEQLLEARNRETGFVFGRLLGTVLPEAQDWTARCDALANDFADLGKRLHRSSRGKESARLISLPGTLLTQTRTPLPSLPPGLRLPFQAAPDASLLLDATGAGEACLAVIARLAPLLSWTGSEVVVVDDGRGPASAQLACLPGLRLAQGTGNGTDRLNAAARAARAPTLVFLDPVGFSASGVAALLRHAATAPGTIAGAALLAVAYNAGLSAPGFPVSGSAPRTGLWILLPIEQFRSFNGLDPTLDDGAGLPMLDLVLRLAEEGREVSQWNEPSWGFHQPGEQAAEARQRFAARWRR